MSTYNSYQETTPAPPAVFLHAERVYKKMLSQSRVEKIDGNERNVYEGHMTKLVTQDLKLAVPYYCTDAETEILTNQGWKTHDRLRKGDLVLTYNNERGYCEWEPVEDVHRFEGVFNMVLMEGKQHSSLTTPNHRWAVVAHNGERQFKTTETLSGADRIPCAAPCVNTPTVQKYSDAFVELVAWFQTEGTLRSDGSVSLSQSESANPVNCSAIRVMLDVVCPGKWREYTLVKETQMRSWELGWGPSRELRAIVDCVRADGKDIAKVVSYDFVTSLTRAQLELFLNTSLAGDGWTCDKTRQFSQKRRAAVEPLQLVCQLLGIQTSLRPSKQNGWVLTLYTKSFCSPVNASKQSNSKFVIEARSYTGTIWCPSTGNETWIARRNGTVYITGNTQVTQLLRGMGCADQIKRGGGSSPSRWILYHMPTLIDYTAYEMNRGKSITQASSSKTAINTQQIQDLSARVDTLEETVQALFDALKPE